MELTRVATELYNVEVRNLMLDPISLEFDVYNSENNLTRYK